MRLLFISSFFPPAWDWGGPVRSMWNLARGLVGLGVEVTVLATNARQKSIVDVPPERVEEGVRIITHPVIGRGRVASANRFGFSPRLWMDSVKKIPGFDLVHMNGFWGATQAVSSSACRFFGKPYVISTRGNLQRNAVSDKRLKKELALLVGTRRTLRKAAALHYTTDLERQWSPDWARDYPSFIVPNPVEIEPRTSGKSFRKKRSISENTLLLGAIGRIHPRKGFDIMVPALGRVVAKHRDVALLVAGPDEGYKGELLRMAAAEGVEQHINMVGELSGAELQEAYAAADVLALPTHGENFGNVVAEAALQGTPALVSDRLGLKDWVAANDAGLVLPLEVDAWAAALDGLKKKDLLKRWAPERIEKLARESFSIEAVARMMLAEYVRIVEEHRGR